MATGRSAAAPWENPSGLKKMIAGMRLDSLCCWTSSCLLPSLVLGTAIRSFSWLVIQYFKQILKDCTVMSIMGKFPVSKSLEDDSEE
jgi:hypothetical protein